MLKVAVFVFLSLPTEPISGSVLDYNISVNPTGCGS
jgi:hypothetical protein